jgi:protein involved in polysaccharide export with SLBB domain
MVASALILMSAGRVLDIINHRGPLIPLDFFDAARIRLMREARFLLAALVALAASGCMRHEANDIAGRGFFTAPQGAQAYAQMPPATQPPSVLQYRAQQSAPPPYAAGGPYVAPASYAYASPASAQPYTLGAGDKLRVVVFGQDGISNSYLVDAGGNVSLPLVGTVPARGASTQQLAQRIAARLRQGYVREPHVSVEVETYRPFFILGEVTTPGQYPYFADMTGEKAIAIAGGFAPRANKRTVELTRDAARQPTKGDVPLTYPLRPGDTVVVKERWF